VLRDVFPSHKEFKGLGNCIPDEEDELIVGGRFQRCILHRTTLASGSRPPSSVPALEIRFVVFELP
jgi:hypothetical protein